MSNLLTRLGVCTVLAAGALGVGAGTVAAQPPVPRTLVLGPLAISPDPLNCLLTTGSSAFCLG